MVYKKEILFRNICVQSLFYSFFFKKNKTKIK